MSMTECGHEKDAQATLPCLLLALVLVGQYNECKYMQMDAELPVN